MQSSSSGLVKKLNMAVLSTVAFGMLYGSACTMGDLRHNVVNGTLSFVKGYTTDLWEALVPAVDDFIGE